MIFESINYWFAVQDFVFSLGAGFAVGFVNQLLSVFFYKGKIPVLIKDMLVSFIFAVTVFSYVISFTNYPVIRIYHVAGCLLGFFCFPFKFSTFFHKISEKILKFLKNKMLCCFKKISTIICGCVEKRQRKNKSGQSEPKNDLLQREEELLYNL